MKSIIGIGYESSPSDHEDGSPVCFTRYFDMFSSAVPRVIIDMRLSRFFFVSM